MAIANCAEFTYHQGRQRRYLAHAAQRWLRKVLTNDVYIRRRPRQFSSPLLILNSQVDTSYYTINPIFATMRCYHLPDRSFAPTLTLAPS